MIRADKGRKLKIIYQIRKQILTVKQLNQGEAEQLRVRKRRKRAKRDKKKWNAEEKRDQALPSKKKKKK